MYYVCLCNKYLFNVIVEFYLQIYEASTTTETVEIVALEAENAESVQVNAFNGDACMTLSIKKDLIESKFGFEEFDEDIFLDILPITLEVTVKGLVVVSIV